MVFQTAMTYLIIDNNKFDQSSCRNINNHRQRC